MKHLVAALFLIQPAFAVQENDSETGLLPPTNLEFPASEESWLTGKVQGTSRDSDTGGGGCGACGR